jgi:hypothetical protein
MKKMTKREMHSEINKLFYEFVDKNFPNYVIDDSEGYGRVCLTNTESDGIDDSIEYHMSRHDLCSFNWASNQCKEDEAVMEEFLAKLVANYDL